VNLPAEARFGPADDAWMSPMFGRPSCMLGAYMREAPGRDRYFSCFEAEMRELGGRPDWGKEFDAAGVRAMYPMADRFASLVAAEDPEGRFVNPRLAAILAPADRGLTRAHP
jgi:hypothetical protein